MDVDVPSALLSTLWQPLVGYCGVCLPIYPRRSTEFESATERCHLAIYFFFFFFFLKIISMSTDLRHLTGYLLEPGAVGDRAVMKV